MRVRLNLTFIPVFAVLINAQGSPRLIADGTKYTPDRLVRQPAVEKLSAGEIAYVKKEALRNAAEFGTDQQVTSAETRFEKDLELLDVAKGLFVSRGIESKAFLYTARSAKSKLNYQGIMVLAASKIAWVNSG